MKNYQTHKSSLFLIELILAIAFFSLASAVCLQLFVKSHLLSRETTQLNTGVNLATSAAEIFRQSNGDIDTLKELIPELEKEESGSADFYTAFYNEDGKPCRKSDAVYTLTLVQSQTKDISSAVIEILLTENNTSIYELPVQIYLPYTH